MSDLSNRMNNLRTQMEAAKSVYEWLRQEYDRLADEALNIVENEERRGRL